LGKKRDLFFCQILSILLNSPEIMISRQFLLIFILIITIHVQSFTTFTITYKSRTKTRRISNIKAFNPDNPTNSAIQSACAGLKGRKSGLFEIDFPLTSQLNRAGSGSLSDAKMIEERQNAFVSSLKAKISLPIIGLGSPCTVYSFSSSLPSSLPFPTDDGSILLCVSPSQPSHYKSCLTRSQTSPTLIVNGILKTTKSVPSTATSLYYQKPLTHNSQISGYLLRSYPSPYQVLDPQGRVLKTYGSEDEVLVRGTNTPDLRDAVKICSAEADRRAIEARRVKK
jgi:hypothetical protein